VIPELDFDRTCTSDEGDSRIQTLMVHVRLMKVIPELHFDPIIPYNVIVYYLIIVKC
jgi:hypothetical protein